MRSSIQRKTFWIICALGILNLLGLTVTFAFKRFNYRDVSEIGILGDELPVQNDRISLMTVEDTDHYGLNGTQADAEWLSTTPANNGYVRVGDEHRYLLTSFGHEIHCVRVFRMAILHPTHPDATSFHISHCLSYLRMYALCNSDLTLEKFELLQLEFSSENLGATHVCRRDWKSAYEEMQRNREAWIKDLENGNYTV
ncbi:hypothetical protein SCHPADRAFT_877343 [Schizopora paradoxa]|uniref:Uncharacterized protein n=1 Tax=Schizopora paradoxa TaxID=27342 RepID=A0A0H2RNQ0_9AGAM|nr:hypothetical protein SCHPADRAFT_877343 [Schizopora paradoxa]